MPDFSFETAAPATPVCGVDEAGRGPWAGPVVAGAAILNPATAPVRLDDSKRLNAARRDVLFLELQDHAVGVGIASVEEIDRFNILNATYLAMQRAIAALPIAPGHLLIDGNRIPPGLTASAEAVVKGDSRSMSIAAASIVAKVTRDRIMQRLAKDYPGYGWERNAGYGVKAHEKALRRLGVTPHHRRSFKPIHKMLCEDISTSH